MNILLTNDDGFYADGLNFLKDYFSKTNKHKIFIVAPDSEKSGFSHSITLKDTIRLVKHIDNLWVLKGTPVDCVTLALLGLVPEKIDWVISGVNNGPNIGKDIIYSGTVGAARQGGLHNLPSMAISVNSWGESIYFDNVQYFMDNYFEKLMKNNRGDFIYNVNIPNIPNESLKGVKKTIPCHSHYYQDELESFDSPGQGKYFWIKGTYPIFENDEGTDAGAIKTGFISVSGVKFLPEAAEFEL